jgi:hypothetical protein
MIQSIHFDYESNSRMISRVQRRVANGGVAPNPQISTVR